MARSIIIVLLGKPGFYPSIPQLGMHIQDLLYERLDDIDIDHLRASLAYQLNIFSEIIQSDDMKITTAKLPGNNIPVLIFAIPVYTGSQRDTVAVTITATEDGNITYNYQIIDDSLLSKL